MGCASSHEVAHDSPPPQTRTAPTTSTTAINAPLSTTTSRHRSQHASHSNISTPRTSTQAALTEHYNTPLLLPAPWTSKSRTWTPSQLARERADFFDSRVSGQPEIWAVLKEVTLLIRNSELVEAQALLDAAEITLPTGRLEQGAYDVRGMLYKLPENIITDPTNLVDDDQTVVGGEGMSKEISVEKDDKGKEVVEKDAVKVRVRLSDRGGPDTVVLMGAKETVAVLVKRLRSEAGLDTQRVRIVYFGKILDEKLSLEEQGWQAGHVVQALVSSFGP